MKRALCIAALPALLIALLAPSLLAYPKPSLYVKFPEFKFEHAQPRRIVLTPPGSQTPRAFWYITYTVTNKTDKKMAFLPEFVLMTSEGKELPSDRDVPVSALAAIKKATGIKDLLDATQITGDINTGDDEAKSGVAIWPEPDPKMGRFSIFVSGLSQESILCKKVNGDFVEVTRGSEIKGLKPEDLLTMRKSLQLTYHLPSDANSNSDVESIAEEWVMRELPPLAPLKDDKPN